MKIIIYISVLFFAFNSLNAQTVLLKETVPEDFSETDNNYGPNRGFFEYPYFNYGVNANIYSHTNDPVMSIHPQSSPKLNFGTKYLFKLVSFSAIVFDFNMGFNQYKLQSNQSYLLIDSTAKVKSAKFQTFSIGGDLSLRFNLKPKRGNSIGKYIDLGGYIDWLWGRQFKTKYEGTIANYSVIAHKISSMNKYQWGLSAKYGGGIFGVFANYRLSNLLKQTDPSVILPRVTVGISIFMSEI